MQSKYLISAVIILAAAAGAGYVLHSHSTSPVEQANTQPGQNNQTNNETASSEAQSIAPISTNVGTVAGVDLSGLAKEANSEASIISQDGSSDSQTMASDGSTINSSTDSINNPIQ